MLCAYGDESSDETKQRVFCVGAVIGAEEQWRWLAEKWRARCDGIPFHANDCDSNQGDFARFDNADNKQRYKDMIEILAESGMGGYACAIDLASQRDIFPEAMDMSYYKAFSETIEHMKNCAHFNSEIVKYVFDLREESTFNAALMYRMMKTIPGWGQYMDELSFEHAKNSSRLQASDLFVREVMKAWDNKVGPVKRKIRKSWTALLATQRFHGEVLGLGWFVSLKESLPRMEATLNMSMQKYADWLNERKLSSDNISNRLMFIDHLGKIDERKAENDQGIQEV
jgi:hypothetical protein